MHYLYLNEVKIKMKGMKRFKFMKKKLKEKKSGFTLAEVLITLAVIGIIAAITLPSLLVNVNERSFDAKKRALVARLSQAIPQISNLSGYGDEDDIEGTASESFIAEGLSKVYKIASVCNVNNLSACGIPDSITTIDSANEIDFPTSIGELNAVFGSYSSSYVSYSSGGFVDTDVAAFETLNGESVAVYYNPECGSDQSSNHYTEDKMCVNFIYDLNGTKGPNQVGKDIGFVTAFYKTDTSVAGPFPYTSDISGNYYSYSDSEYDAASACKAVDEDLRLPDRDELASMYVNMRLLNISSGYYWSGSVISAGSSGLAWAQHFDNGNRNRNTRSNSDNVRCVYK